MYLFVKFNRSADADNEVALIELQGELECRSRFAVDSHFVGDLCFKQQQDGNVYPALIIGHHILNGKIHNLDRPLALLELKKHNNQTREFAVKAIITKKISFKTRPKPIIIGS